MRNEKIVMLIKFMKETVKRNEYKEGNVEILTAWILKINL